MQAAGRAAAHLGETYVLGVLPEALSADVEAVLPDQAPLIAAHTAARTEGASAKLKETSSSSPAGAEATPLPAAL